MSTRHHAAGAESGFSLIDILMVLALLALALGLGVPSFHRMLSQQHRTTVLNELGGELALARSQAVRSHSRTTLCPLASGERCGEDWNQGRLLFLDRNGNGQHEADETILLRHEGDGGLRLSWRGSLGRPYAQMLPTGTTNHLNGMFVVCDIDGDPTTAKALIVNKMGRSRPSQDRNHDGIEEDASGAPLRCR